MTKIRFSKKLGTAHYGTVLIGDIVDVSDIDARRYIANGFADKMDEPKPKRKPAVRGRNGKEG